MKLKELLREKSDAFNSKNPEEDKVCIAIRFGGVFAVAYFVSIFDFFGNLTSEKDI